jgi:hypothetical protein
MSDFGEIIFFRKFHATNRTEGVKVFLTHSHEFLIKDKQFNHFSTNQVRLLGSHDEQPQILQNYQPKHFLRNEMLA